MAKRKNIKQIAQDKIDKELKRVINPFHKEDFNSVSLETLQKNYEKMRKSINQSMTNLEKQGLQDMSEAYQRVLKSGRTTKTGRIGFNSFSVKKAEEEPGKFLAEYKAAYAVYGMKTRLPQYVKVQREEEEERLGVEFESPEDRKEFWKYVDLWKEHNIDSKFALGSEKVQEIVKQYYKKVSYRGFRTMTNQIKAGNPLELVDYKNTHKGIKAKILDDLFSANNATFSKVEDIEFEDI